MKLDINPKMLTLLQDKFPGLLLQLNIRNFIEENPGCLSREAFEGTPGEFSSRTFWECIRKLERLEQIQRSRVLDRRTGFSRIAFAVSDDFDGEGGDQ